MRFLILLAVIFFPVTAAAQTGNSDKQTEWKNRLGNLAKKIANEESATEKVAPTQPQPAASQPTAAPSQNTNFSVGVSLGPEGQSRRFSGGQKTTLDVAGIEIGMTPALVGKKLLERGYSPAKTKKGPTFEGLVTIKRDQLSYNDSESLRIAISEQVFETRYETVTVKYLSVPEGIVVNEIVYKNTDPGLENDKAVHLLKDKYGKDVKSQQIIDLYSGQIALLPPGHPHVMTLRKKRDRNLSLQGKFVWLNRSAGRRGKDLVGSDAQHLSGSLPRSSNGLNLKLEAEALWETYQKQSIQDQLGPSKTTF